MIIDNTTYRSPDNRSNARSQGVDMLVLHSTETRSLEETARCFMVEKERNVSIHYVVDRDGRIYQFVPESRAANHAGKSSWRMLSGEEVTNINARSIGIEFQRGPGETFTPAQIQAGLALSKNITSRYGIHPSNVVGHSDIAPGRKSDPGNDFPWELFVQNQIAANAHRRGGDGRSTGYDPNLMAAAQQGAFNITARETPLNTQTELAHVESQKTKTEEKSTTQELISTLLMAGLSFLTGSSNNTVAGIATLASAVTNGPTASQENSSSTESSGLLPKLAASSILGDSPVSNLLTNTVLNNITDSSKKNYS